MRNMWQTIAGACMFGCAMVSQCKPYQEDTVYVGANVYPSEREALASVILLSSDGAHLPSCGGVSISGKNGLTVLATAAHCVRHKIDPFDPAPNAEKESHIGDTILYVTRNQWRYTADDANVARIFTIDEPRDRATLLPKQGEAPFPLPTMQLCDDCSMSAFKVHSVAPVYGWARHDGMATGRTYAGESDWYYESTTDIDYGWSGSPVLDDQGFVIGMMVMCAAIQVRNDDHMVSKCKPRWSVFTSVPQ